MKATYLSVDSAVRGVGRSQVLPVVNELAARGWDMRLVSCERSVGDALDIASQCLHPSVEYAPVEFGRAGPRGAAGRMVRLRRAMGAPDLIHCRSDQPMVAALTARPRRPLVWDSRSFWAEQKVATGVISANGLTFRLAEAAERLSATHADAILALSDAGLAAMSDKWGISPPVWAVVPTLVDCERFADSPIPETQQIEGIFSGSYNKFYDLPLAAAFLECLNLLTPVKVTWTCEEATDVARLAPVSVDTLLRTSYDLLPSVIASGHFGLAICNPYAGRSLKMAMPTKIGEFLASGRPVVVNHGLGDMDALIDRWGVGVAVESGDAGELRQAAEKLISLLEDRETPARCRTVAVEHFSLQSGIDRIDRVYRDVIEG